ncbi:MAG: hypothetical protein KA715_10775 [Xanthomonadaceae bacterium]|nr:hypothetical protein [Xanthomonadaceae bacterium]
MKRSKNTRALISRDGSFNVISRGVDGLKIGDLYHTLLTLHGGILLLLTFALFIAVNVIFATLYYSCGPTALDGIDPRNGFSYWFDCFFFSVQTFATIGYGKMVPIGTIPNILTVIESFISLMMGAIITGIFFSKFSRATARVLFSNKACITTVDSDLCLFFRMANERFNQIVDAEIDFYLLKRIETKEGKTYRVPIHLELETKRISIFALGFTVFHIIGKHSPLHGLTEKDIHQIDGQFVVTVRGLDGTMNQTIHARHAYSPNEVMWGHDFVDMMNSTKEVTEIDLSLIHDTHAV